MTFAMACFDCRADHFFLSRMNGQNDFLDAKFFIFYDYWFLKAKLFLRESISEKRLVSVQKEKAWCSSVVLQNIFLCAILLCNLVHNQHFYFVNSFYINNNFKTLKYINMVETKFKNVWIDKFEYCGFAVTADDLSWCLQVRSFFSSQQMVSV